MCAARRTLEHTKKGMGPLGPIPSRFSIRVGATTPYLLRTRCRCCCCRRRCGFRRRCRHRGSRCSRCRSRRPTGSSSRTPNRSDRRCASRRCGCRLRCRFRRGFPSCQSPSCPTRHSGFSTPGSPDCPWNLTPCEGRHHCRPRRREAAKSIPRVTYANRKGPPPPKGRVRSWWAILGGNGSSLPQNLVR